MYVNERLLLDLTVVWCVATRYSIDIADCRGRRTLPLNFVAGWGRVYKYCRCELKIVGEPALLKFMK